ncbi:hypothetical protein [Bradyrhizobium sp. Tv2a-2]|uniref:hypothetical protein n=1 Tax=Bradyrhizobium sp. Tv2a-2 TaxID=113395 RepID=UPI0012EBB1C9|nr:hypothetical protein [Bradyrhizobium sp. Tv2a-2]
MWVLLAIAVICAAVALRSVQHAHRPQVDVAVHETAPAPKTHEIELPSAPEPATVDLSDLKPAIDMPVTLPAPRVDERAAIKPHVDAHASIAHHAAPQSHRRHARHRHSRHHHPASRVCLSPGYFGRERDFVACFTFDAADVGGMVR